MGDYLKDLMKITSYYGYEI